MTPKYIVDANVVIRFLTEDHLIHSPAARIFFEEAQQGKHNLVLTEMCIAEVVWVLISYYKKDRRLVSKFLETLIQRQGMIVPNKEVMLNAFERFGKTKIDFIDCYFAALSVSRRQAVVSFDRDLDKFKDVKRIEPEI